MWPGILALSIPFVGSGTRLEVGAGAEGVTRGGTMAISPDEPSTPAVDFTLALLSGVRATSQRTTFILRYRPQYYYQIPNVAGSSLPLFLHRVDSSYITAPSRRTTVNLAASGSAGAISYTSLLQQFPQGTAAAATGFIPLATVGASATVAQRTSTTNTLSIGANSNFRTVLGSDVENSGVTPSLGAGIVISDSLRLSLVHQVGASFTVNYIASDLMGWADTQQSAVIQESLIGEVAGTWNMSFDRTSDLNLSLGAAVSAVNGPTPSSAFPTFNVAFTKRSRGLGSTWVSHLSGGVYGYLDPLLAVFRPQAATSLGIGGQHGRKLRSQLSYSLSTSLAPEALSPAQYETNGNLFLTIAYQVSEAASLSTGGAWQLRMGHWSQLSTPEGQNQVTVMFGFRYVLSTRAREASWL
ncbi:MAG TPA: hypothetical protein VN764_03735 [Polyangiaceae bacterium]|nr:hypothetical protein [Polyangiaceae bacterium]